jgi:hypothetical protein
LEDEIRAVLGQYLENLRLLDESRDRNVEILQEFISQSRTIFGEWQAAGPHDPLETKGAAEGLGLI